jgi:spore maturation protein CgeB
MRKPLVVADTFHFRDYFREGEVMRYEAGSSESLRAQIDFLMGNPEAAVTMTARAYDRVTSQFTHTKYVENLLRACADWSESGFSGAPL